MRTLALSGAAAAVAAAMALAAPTDPGRAFEAAPAPLLKGPFTR